MPASKIKADYEQLFEISKIFNQHHENITQQLAAIRQGLEPLINGDWEGIGANLFFDEMSSSVIPAIKKLSQALAQASQSSKDIVGKMQKAEQDAARLLLINGNMPKGGGPSGGGGGAKPSKPVITDKQIQDAINKKDRAEAIRLTIEKYNINVSTAKKVTYDPKTSGDGATSPAGKIWLGDDAFASPQWLASTIGHEMVHVNQIKDRWYTGPVGSELNEVEAYDWELKNAKQTGVSTTEVQELNRRRKSHYDALPKDVKARVDKGDYTLSTGHESD